MSSSASPKKRSSLDKVRAHRARLRQQGLKPVQFWLPDTHTRGFKLDAHRQSLAIARSEHDRDDQAFVDSISEWGSD